MVKRTIRDKNEIIKHEDYAEVILYNRKNKEKARVKIDIEDIDLVKDIKWGHWSWRKNEYADHKKIGRMHRLIVDAPENTEVDHINHDGLDNRKTNLRVCTHQENMMNKREAKGYYFDKAKKKWIVRINVKRKVFRIGRYKTEQEAKEARKLAEIKYFGEFRYKDR